MAVGLSQDEEPPPPAARQNPLLRDYFRQEYLGRRGEPGLDVFLESYVDRRIDHFLEQSHKSLQALRDSMGLLLRLVQPASGGLPQSSSALETGKALAEMASEAGRLRRQLASVFPKNLRSGSELTPLSSEETGKTFSQDLAEISSRLAQVERHLEDYLFGNHPVVSAQDLKERDVLVLLHEIQTICRQAERSVNPE